MGALSQTMGTWDRPVAYLPKRLDNIATGWLGCLRAVAAVALLVQEATRWPWAKIWSQKSHMRSTLPCKGTPINGCQHPRLLNTRDCYVRIPMLLLSLVMPWIWPLSFLWEKVGPHVIARKYANRPDLRDQPILDPDLVLNTNGTRLVKQGQWLSGCAVVMEETIVEASSLPSHWSAQWPELHALIQAL